jgi:hypothetical protein
MAARVDGSFAADCLRDDRAIAFQDGSSRIRSYACKTDNTEAPQLRVEFHRLSETSAGNLLLGVQSPTLDPILGQPKILQNEVGVEAKKLFDQFAFRQTISGCLATLVETPKGGTDYKAADSSCQERPLVFFNVPQSNGPSMMPLPDDNIFIKTKTSWPPNYRFYYLSQCDDPISCTVLWRATNPRDLDQFRSNWHRQNKLDKIDDSDPSLAAAQLTIEKYFGLARYLMRDGWRDDFLIITGLYAGCGGFNFNIHPRKMILDVATIENISSSRVQLNGILLTEGAGGLRRANDLSPSDKMPKTVEYSVELAPREKALVPLRISWPAASSLDSFFGDSALASRQYAIIQRSPQGTIFNVKEDGNIQLRKIRESFGLPSRPNMDEYIYGPALEVTGVIANGKTVSLTERSRNFLSLTVSSEEGSCPFLYAWNPDTKDWTWYGKVIHRAKFKQREMTQQIVLTRFATRFRLSEQELELSHIDYVALTVEIQGGDRHTLKPTMAALSEIDENYVRIPAGTAIEVEFELPADLKDAVVERSTLSIRGYYEPYSHLNIGSNVGRTSPARAGLARPGIAYGDIRSAPLRP